MTPAQWARVLHAGEHEAHRAYMTETVPDPSVILSMTLGAMAREAGQIAQETR